MGALEEVEKKVGEGARLPVMFEELKKLQRKFRDSKLNREHRNKVWEKLDATFKFVKEKRFGASACEEGNSPYQRTKRRFDGLMNAIGKMEASIKRDRNDLDFQNHKIATTGGQLEAQIRQAKMKMIEERVRSKEEKLAEMIATKIDLEKRLASQKEKEARIEAQRAAKAKIAQEIKESEAAREADAEKLEKAAEEIVEAKTNEPKEEKPKKGKEPKEETAKAEEPKAEEESMMDAVSATVGESLTDVVDTIKAAATIIGGKIGEAMDDLKEDAAEAMEEAKEKATKMASEFKEEMAEAKKKATKITEEVKKEVNDEVAEVKKKAAKVVEDIKEEISGEEE